MLKINEHYLKLQSSYLFAEIARRVNTFQQENPDKELIKLGIGDVTRALPPACIAAFHQAIDEMGADSTFRGYGPEQGYGFLREINRPRRFSSPRHSRSRPMKFSSVTAPSAIPAISRKFLPSDARVAIPDPVYPVYVDTNVMAGRTGAFCEDRYEGLVYLDSTRQNGYVPELPDTPVDLIYLCFPNNPTGATITKEQLATWVAYAKANQALILFDAAYEAFIQDDTLPHSIFEIEGAHEVAIEFRSFSKTAGFTGTRCAYTVVPKACMAFTADGQPQAVHTLWNRRHTTKFNSVSYPVQRAAEAVYSPEGKQQVQELIDYYMQNAAFIREKIAALGLECVGGENSPYIWVSSTLDSWTLFDRLLHDAGVVCTPGAGFGKCGQGHIRISAFNSFENVQTAMQRISQALA